MAALQPPVCVFDLPAPDFALMGVDGRVWTRDECKGTHGLVVMFICNHCPYVQAVRERIIRDALVLEPLGVNFVAIMPNDYTKYPEDSLDNMRQVAERYAFPFLYLLDDTQDVAKAYGAVCTPDFFGYNSSLRLQYRGRLDASSKNIAPPETRRDLLEAMRLVAQTGKGPTEQIPSIGCSIKWRDG